jgi:hypothetical protein
MKLCLVMSCHVTTMMQIVAASGIKVILSTIRGHGKVIDRLVVKKLFESIGLATQLQNNY